MCFAGSSYRGYGCLTGVSSYFQLFELCKTGADGGTSILHQSEGGTKWSAMVRCFPFLEETSERDEHWWTAITSTDGANGSNRKSLAGLNVEKLRGESTPLWTRSVAQMDHVLQKF